MIDPFRLVTTRGQIDGAELRRMAEAVRKLELLTAAPRAQFLTTPGGSILLVRSAGNQLQLEINGGPVLPPEPVWNFIPQNGLSITATDVPGQRLDVVFRPQSCPVPVLTGVCLIGSGGIRNQYQLWDPVACAYVGHPWCVDNPTDCCPSSCPAPCVVPDGTVFCLSLLSGTCKNLFVGGRNALTQFGTFQRWTGPGIFFSCDELNGTFEALSMIWDSVSCRWSLGGILYGSMNTAAGSLPFRQSFAFPATTAGCPTDGLTFSGQTDPTASPFRQAFTFTFGLTAGACGESGGGPTSGGGGGPGCPAGTVDVPCVTFVPPAVCKSLLASFIDLGGCPGINGMVGTVALTYTGSTWQGTNSLNGTVTAVSVYCNGSGALLMTLAANGQTVSFELNVGGPPFVASRDVTTDQFVVLGICPANGTVRIFVS